MHFAAGPWFEVREATEDWQELGRVWLSDGDHSGPGALLYRVRFEDTEDIDEQGEAT